MKKRGRERKTGSFWVYAREEVLEVRRAMGKAADAMGTLLNVLSDVSSVEKWEDVFGNLDDASREVEESFLYIEVIDEWLSRVGEISEDDFVNAMYKLEKVWNDFIPKKLDMIDMFLDSVSKDDIAEVVPGFISKLWRVEESVEGAQRSIREMVDSLW